MRRNGCGCLNSHLCKLFSHQELQILENIGKMYHNVIPLVELDGQVSVRLNPLGVSRVHDRLTSWPDSNGFGQFRVS